MEINEPLKNQRKETGLTQEECGVILGISINCAQKYINNYENKTTIPDTLLMEFAKKYPDKLVLVLTLINKQPSSFFRTTSLPANRPA